MCPERNASVWPGIRGKSNGVQLAGAFLCRRWHLIQDGILKEQWDLDLGV